MTVKLNARGISVSENRVERIMRKHNISAVNPKIY